MAEGQGLMTTFADDHMTEEDVERTRIEFEKRKAEESRKWDGAIRNIGERFKKAKGYYTEFSLNRTAAELDYMKSRSKGNGLPYGCHPYFDSSSGVRFPVCIASFHRASDGALSKLVDLVKPVPPERAAYIILPGDRKETFEFALEWYGRKPLIHLWAGEISQGTHDEIYRWAITNMSRMQWCTTAEAAQRVRDFFKAIGKEHDVYVVGNVMLDNIPKFGYDLVLYNPPTTIPRELVEEEVNKILDILSRSEYETYFWIPPNGDAHTDLVEPHVNARGLTRNQFLNLLKNCSRFISNSSCIEYEARHIISDDQIICIGLRNEHRSSKDENMSIPGATDKMMDILGGLSGKPLE